MAVNKQTGYQKGSLDNKESDDALRNLGPRLNVRETGQLRKIFNTLPEGLEGLVKAEPRLQSFILARTGK